jgi:triacylglycerol lipase
MKDINFAEILEYALRAQLAYNLDRLGWELSKTIGWRRSSNSELIVREVERSEVNVIVEIDVIKRVQWIGVRGSSNFRNWMLNLRYMQRSFEKNFASHRIDIDLHTGFYLAAEDVYQTILPYLKPDYQTRLTGHSLGGAIATILMMFLKEDGYIIGKCITFGQPKITDRQGAAMGEGLPLLRIVNHEDVVPLLPPSTLFTRFQGGYHHFGNKLVLGEDRDYTYIEETQNNSMYNFWMRLLGSIAQPGIADSVEQIKDHNMALYLLKIAQNIPQADLEDLLCVLSSQIEVKDDRCWQERILLQPEPMC